MPSVSPDLDELKTRFWLRSVAAGCWATLGTCAGGLAYVAFYAHTSNGLVIAAIIAITMAFAAASLWLVPWERFVRSRLREPALLAWTVATVLVIGLAAALDGGAASPMALALVLPTCFASLAYSRFRVLAVGLATEVALGVLVLIQEWRQRLTYESQSDPLTGLLNRRGFANAAANAFEDFRSGRARVTLVLLDLDLFKDYNDVHGHLAGDALLRWVADELAATVRAGDSVARIGGDEFAVLVPEADPESATALIARIEARLSRRAPHSLGTAVAPVDGDYLEQLYEVADAALYARKSSRRRRSSAVA
jgi:diguanylate cyclase (GGDEF)-like protein